MTHSLMTFAAMLAVPVGIMLALISLEVRADGERRAPRKAIQRGRPFASGHDGAGNGVAVAFAGTPDRGHDDDREVSMQIAMHSTYAEFWSAEYRDRPIAILYRHGRMHVYLDHVLQHNVVFESGTDALAWLVRRIDQGVPARVN